MRTKVDGPWNKEPDFSMFHHLGLPCLVLRGPHSIGHLCGYVGIPAGHPVHGKNYNDFEIEVHYGLTFGGNCPPPTVENPVEGSEGYWWFGFDCAHAGDLTPCDALDGKYLEMQKQGGAVYRDFEYVKAEVKSLAEQLKAMSDAKTE